MKAAAPAILYALFVWWFTTGMVLLLVLRRRAAVRIGLAGAVLLFPLCLYLLAKSSMQTAYAGVYVAFTAAVLLWGTQEMAFLTGFLTGPRPLPCPVDARGTARVGYAIMAILYHELALIASGLAIVAVTWHGINQVGFWTFLVLYVMRISAKLNLFLGVPILNDETMPAEIAHLRSYFRRGPVNAFFPIAMMIATLMTVGFLDAATDPGTTTAAMVGWVLVSALMGLAILEHVFMLVPLPIDRLWRWSTRSRRDGSPATGLGTREIAVEAVLPTQS